MHAPDGFLDAGTAAATAVIVAGVTGATLAGAVGTGVLASARRGRRAAL